MRFQVYSTSVIRLRRWLSSWATDKAPLAPWQNDSLMMLRQVIIPDPAPGPSAARSLLKLQKTDQRPWFYSMNESWERGDQWVELPCPETATANGNSSSRVGGVVSDSNADTRGSELAWDTSLFLQMSSSDASIDRHHQTRDADETGRAISTLLKQFGGE